MASSPLSTHSTSLDDLPPELRCKLTQYLGESDLVTLRSVNRYWNSICKPELRKRKRLAFNFLCLDKLVQFNDTFAKFSPTEDIVAGKFSFYLPVLCTAAAKEPLDTFVQKFGCLVTSLFLNLNTTDWSNEKRSTSSQRDTVRAHVTLLLQGVKGQVQALEILDFTGLQPSVIGWEPFPRLRTLILKDIYSPHGSMNTVALQEATIMLLSRKVPAVRRFEFKRRGRYYPRGDPSFLVNILRNLVRVNGQVEVKLTMDLLTYLDEDFEEATGDDRAILHDLMKETVRFVDLDVVVYSPEGQTNMVRQTLGWIEAHSDWLKKLTFRVGIAMNTPFGGLKFPRLRALEELNYDQTTKESLLQYDSPDHFPSLRTVSTVSTGNDFTVALPQVTALTLDCGSMSGVTARGLGRYGQALYQLPPFPNVETLTCPLEFIDLASLVTLKNLRRIIVQFNDTFAKYSPTEDIAAGLFCFKLSALDTVAATVHLNTFVQRFGQLVTSLSLNLESVDEDEDSEWLDDPPRRDTVLAHLTLLLREVKGQVQDLDLSDYTGLVPSVFGREPFPRLLTLALESYEDPSLDTVALQEASILLLSRSVPALRVFEFKAHRGLLNGDLSFLAKVLRNLVQVKPEVEVKLRLKVASDGARLFDLMKEPVRIVDLDLDLVGGDQAGTLRKTLSWIGAQRDWLKKLRIQVPVGGTAPLGGLKLPSLRALEELEYVQPTVEPLLKYDSPDYFPSLRTVTTVCPSLDFTVALPQVTELALYHLRPDLAELVARKYGRSLIQLPQFPNVETFSCPLKLIDLASLVTLKNLRRLSIRMDEGSMNGFYFWERATHGARQLTLEEIRELPEPSENEIRERAGPHFSDLTNLKELKIVVYYEDLTFTANLDTLVFLSKTKRLKRLEKLEIELGERFYWEVPKRYLDELRKFHSSVFVSRPEMASSDF